MITIQFSNNKYLLTKVAVNEKQFILEPGLKAELSQDIVSPSRPWLLTFSSGVFERYETMEQALIVFNKIDFADTKTKT